MKIAVFSSVLILAAGPGAEPDAIFGVPHPPVVKVVQLQEPGAQPVPVLQEGDSGGTGARAAEGAGIATRQVEVQGRTLSLSLVRSGAFGMAVLNAPQSSLIASLPEIGTEEFLALAAAQSGCDPSGQVDRVSSGRGLIALAVRLTCG